MKLATLIMAVMAIGVLPRSSSQASLVPVQAWGQADRGLRIGIAAVNSGSPDVQFDVALENVGPADFVLNLGYMLGNGKVMFPYSVRLVLTGPTGQTRELQYFDRKYPGIGGRVDDFVVAMRAGSRYTIRATMDHYRSLATKEFSLKLTNGRYRIVARFEGKGAQNLNSGMSDVALLNFWQGVVQSNPLEFVVASGALTSDVPEK